MTTSATPQVSVLIVEDHLVVAEALASLLDESPGIRVLKVAGTMADAIATAQAGAPDVVVMDFRLPDGTGADAAAAIREQLPETAFVFLSADESDDSMIAAVEAGASVYLSKSTSAPELTAAVLRAAGGDVLIPPARLAGLVARQRRQARSEAERLELLGGLTKREREVLGLMAEGLDNRAIAARLVIDYSTVRSHVRSLLHKLDARTKLEAVARASQAGLVG